MQQPHTAGPRSTEPELSATTIEPSQKGPGTRLSHREWMRAADEEYVRLLALLDALEPADWKAPTDCTGWDVRSMVAHLAGAAQAMASMRETRRQLREGRALLPDADSVDGMNAVQVNDRADHAPAQLRDELRAVAPRAVRSRTRIPRPIRALPIRFGPPLGTQRLSYLSDAIYTRDAWLHRIDICRATGHDLRLTADHDGRIVDDVVHEWAALHGEPFVLRLTGDAGGSWRSSHDAGGGDEVERIELDAIEFCRILSGRGLGAGLLATRVNF